MFEGFSTARIAIGDAEINVLTAGGGPPALLLHGYPQTHVVWHKVAPLPAAKFTLVIPGSVEPRTDKARSRRVLLKYVEDTVPPEIRERISGGVRFFRIGLRRLISCSASSPPLSYSSLNR
jgi:hypothetical protein